MTFSYDRLLEPAFSGVASIRKLDSSSQGRVHGAASLGVGSATASRPGRRRTCSKDHQQGSPPAMRLDPPGCSRIAHGLLMLAGTSRHDVTAMGNILSTKEAPYGRQGTRRHHRMHPYTEVVGGLESLTAHHRPSTGSARRARSKGFDGPHAHPSHPIR